MKAQETSLFGCTMVELCFCNYLICCVCVCFFVLLLPLHCSFSLLLKCLCVYILIVVRRHCIFQSKQLRPGGHARCCRTFAPSSRTHPGGMRDRLLSWIQTFINRESIEVVLSDSAANEIAASNVNRGRRALQIESDTADTLLPNLKLVARDHAHSFRHVLQRPFKSSDYLCQLMDNNVLHGNSIVRVIDGSFVFRQWFEIEVGKMGGTAHNLKSDSCHGNK